MRYCNHCGAPLEEGARFCRVCGFSPEQQQGTANPVQPPFPRPVQQPPAPGRYPGRSPAKDRPARRPLWALLGAGIMLAVFGAMMLLGLIRFGSGSPAAAGYEGKGYATPEAAAEAYVKALAANDLGGMISTFAVETAVEHIDGAAYLNRMRAFNYGLVVNGNLPLRGKELGGRLDVENRLCGIVTQIDRQYLYLAFHGTAYEDGVQSGALLALQDENQTEAFLSVLNADRVFGDVRLDGIRTAEEAWRGWGNDSPIPRYDESLARYAQQYGAEEIRESEISLRIGGQCYLLYLTHARYGDRWYNITFFGMLPTYLSLPVSCGGLITEAELSD